MSETEQDLILFFKLYLLSRRSSYINYMAQAKTLIKWFDWKDYRTIEIREAPIYCGSCFKEVGKIYGGNFTIHCSHCSGSHNIAYEIQQLARHTEMNWDYCIYLMCKAIEDIYKSNNVRVFQNLIM